MAQSRHRLQTLSVHNHFRNVRLFKEQELGHGSFATVCRAACDSLLCAAKVLHPEFFDQGDPGEENFVAKFIEECNILPSITHPNIVQCFGTYQDPETDLPVLLMELMDESLTGYLERAGEPLPFHAEVSFSYDVALGLSYLHSRGYVHRDLSSNNVLLMAGIRAKITDFGMCRATTGPNQSRLTQCPGTQAYMPPEALVEYPVYTAKLDVFSHGVLMIQIMSRQFPKPGPAHRMLPTSGLLQAIAEEERRANHIKYVNFDHQMLPLAKRCIQNSHSRRPSSDAICSALSSLKESRFYQQSKDEDSVERKLERAELRCQRLLIQRNQEFATLKGENSALTAENSAIRNQFQLDLEKKEINHREYCQQLQSIHQEEVIKIMSDHSQEIERTHYWYKQRLRQQAPTPEHNNCAESSSLLFDPSNLPEPAYNAHELELFHREACGLNQHVVEDKDLPLDRKEGQTSSNDYQNLLHSTLVRPKPKPRRSIPITNTHMHEPDSQTLLDNEEINTLSIPSGSNITSVYSTSSLTTCENDLEQESLSLVHTEAHTSHESDSPLPSIEQTPSMISKSDPYPGTSHGKASSVYSREKSTFKEIDVHDNLGSWVHVDMDTQKQSSSLDSELRADAFSTRPAKTDKKAAQDMESIFDRRFVQDIQSAIPCWYCTNLTKDRVCGVCGNIQPDILRATPCWYCTNMTNERVCDVCGNTQLQNIESQV